MRDGRVWPGVAALALAIALAACGGADVAPTPAASSTPTAADTPAAVPTPTATATPTAVPTPTAAATSTAVPTPTAAATSTAVPTPTAAADPSACASGTLGGARASSPALAADCDTLLAIKATLEGTATLNWSPDTALTAWEGVTVSGDPKRVTRIVIPGGARSSKLNGTLPAQLGRLTALTALDLSDNALRGSIPAQLGEINALANLAISGNSFTGCIPNVLWSVADKDLAKVGLADCSAPVTLDSSQDFPRGGATYRIVEHLDAIIFNVPEGASIVWWDVEYGDCFGHQGPCYPSIILRDENSGSRLCLDSVTAEECGRRIVSADGGSGQHDSARINEVFDRIANSARPEPKPTPGPVVMRYGAPQADGVVDAPGEYAFFSADGPITTYEGLRQDVERLVIHERDADGTSWESFYAGVEAGDDFEWREADDCWVRYLVDEVLPDPTDAPLKALAVRWITYAYTGCSGAVSATGDRMWTWAPPNIRGPDVTVPVRHGPVLLIPSGWSGDIEEPVRVNPRAVGVEESATGAGAPKTFKTTDLTEARTIPLWRDVTLPVSDWRFVSAQAGTYDSPPYGHGFQADYGPAQGGIAFSVAVGHMQVVPGHATAHYPGNTISIQETRIIDGYPALVLYNPDGKSPLAPTSVLIYDEENGIVYVAYGYIGALIGSNISPLIEIARSLFAEPPPVVMRYGAPQMDGVVDAPGEYAFFSADGPITTYEGLRQDVERLVIHERDADGTSWESFYAGVEAGDDFEWREADDCWVRYLVDEVLPDPTDAPLKALAVRRYGYAYTGCSGAVATTGDRMWTWVPPNIQSPNITVPVRHGIWLLLPPAYWNSLDWEGTDGVYEERIPLPGSSQAAQPEVSTDLAVVQQHPLWRTPDLPDGWTLRWGGAGLEGIDGYHVIYSSPRGGIGVDIYVERPRWHPQKLLIDSPGGTSVFETRTIDGHFSIIQYSPTGENRYPIMVAIFDESSGISYTVVGIADILGSDLSAVINVARSLYLEEDQP